MYGGAAVHSYSRTQRCMATPWAEAEYIALSACSKELMFVKQVWSFLRPQHRAAPLKMYEDNQSAIFLAKNPQSSRKTKHIDVAYHYVRSLVEQGKIEVAHVTSEDQRADTLTKSLGREVFEGHRNCILNRNDDVHRRSKRLLDVVREASS